jgi:arylsulfatase A-like enzyme
MLPQYLKELGYGTIGIGKWHQGFFKKEYIPTSRGFDSHLGYWGAEINYFNKTMLNEKGWIGKDFRYNQVNIDNDLKFKPIYSTDVYTREAIKVIKNWPRTGFGQTVEKPLFLYLAHQASHAPLESTPQYENRFLSISNKTRRTIAGMISAMDDSIGDIISALNDSKMLENTLIVFTNDNGGELGSQINDPLRGGKFTLHEGGIRNSAFVWSTKLKNKGYISEQLMFIGDLFSTIYSAAGGNIANLGPIDGIDFWNVLNENIKIPKRSDLLHNIDDVSNTYAVRSGDYKLIYGKFRYDGWYSNPSDKYDQFWNVPNYLSNWSPDFKQSKVYKILKSIGREVKTINKVVIKCNQFLRNIRTCNSTIEQCLFNIKLDPCEYNNLARVEPQKVAQLMQVLQRLNATAVPPQNKVIITDERANPIYHNGRWDIWE